MGDISMLPPTRNPGDMIPSADPNNLGTAIRNVNADAETALILSLITQS